MADQDWPSDIPQSFQQSGFSDEPMGGVIRTDMDTGYAKVRRRFTSVTDMWSGTMVMTTTELATFKSFFKNTIKYGSLRFNFPDQYNLSGPTVEARFNINTGGKPYSLSPDGDSQDWQVKFTLEVFT